VPEAAGLHYDLHGPPPGEPLIRAWRIGALLAVCARDDVLVPSIASTRIAAHVSPFNGGTEVTIRWADMPATSPIRKLHPFALAWLAVKPLVEE
jgi:hypothetical protein